MEYLSDLAITYQVKDTTQWIESENVFIHQIQQMKYGNMHGEKFRMLETFCKVSLSLPWMSFKRTIEWTKIFWAQRDRALVKPLVVSLLDLGM